MAMTPNWKILTVGAALAGLGVTGTGIALADDPTGTSHAKAIEVTAVGSPGVSPTPATPTEDDHRAGSTGTEHNADDADDTADDTDNTPDGNTPDDPDDSPDDALDGTDDTPDEADDNTPDGD
ncbi:hypothetical protein AB8O38_10045 [Saccharomonospora xinjiangensis]|uniref:hypothetical protein n=1 Tax=Saccharomonospora xinjiangensis TaxID=75294 RepID=UPI00350EC619